MNLEFLKNVEGCFNEIHEKGSVIIYKPWDYKWQGMTEQERIPKGIFVHCHGMGEFDLFNEGADVRRKT